MQILTNTKETLTTTTTPTNKTSLSSILIKNNINNNDLEFSLKKQQQRQFNSSKSIDDFDCYNLLKDELKYMKGYVNVLKERFSCGRLNSNNVNDVISLTSLPSTTTTTTATTTQIQLDPVIINNNNKIRTQQTHNLLNKNNRIFASQENLNPLSIQKSSVSQQQSQQVIIKCTYLNEINTDELPKPNFVSSVKNLFEKKTNNKQQQQQQQQNQQQQQTPKTKSRYSAPANIDNIESFVDKLKQHGTLVYEHNVVNNKKTQSQPQSLSPSLSQPTSFPPSTPTTVPNRKYQEEKSLSVKERKELFNKKNYSSPLTSSHQQIEPTKQTTPITKPVVIKQQQQQQVKQIDQIHTNSISKQNDQNDINDDLDINQVLLQQKSKLKAKSFVKTKTFFGGQEVNDVKSISPVKSLDSETIKIEFLNAEVKLTKPSITKNSTSNGHKKRVNFDDNAETYEYPSYEFMIKEMGIDPLTDPDYNDFNNFLRQNDTLETSTKSDEDIDESILPLNTNTSTNNFNNFKPSWYQRDYQLGSTSLNREQVSSDKQQLQREQVNKQDDSLTNDILPMKDDETKRWSTDIDANILF